MRKDRITILMFVAALLIVPRDSVRAEPDAAPGSAWPPAQSDLPADPSLVDGVLPNGTRFLILPNAEPKDHVSMRLVVAAGSIHENDDERGLAHFVEHMAFRGTREYPRGRMTTELQRLGIALGPDSTAFTSYDHTIFHLELPDAAASTLRTALHAFREYAGAVTFDPDSIERERGVVLNEMRMRDTPTDRAIECNLQLLWPDSREARRKVIGDPAAIRTFAREQFVAFYDAWYRPERMALIIVGAVDPVRTRELVAAEFGDLQARAPARPVPPDATTTRCAQPDVGVHRDPDTVGLWVSFQVPRHTPPMPDTHAERVRRIHRSLAFAMFQLRLRKLANNPHTAFVAPSATSSGGIRDWDVYTVGVNGRVNAWRAVALELEIEHRRALQYGFTRAELEETRRSFLMMYEEAERSAATRPSPWLARKLVQTLLYGTIFATPAETRRDIAAEIESATLAQCLTAFRAAWLPTVPTVFASAHTSFDISRDELADALNESRNIPITRPDDVPLAEFAYTDFGPPGRLVRHEHLPDLDVQLAAFENGVRFNFKSTTFEADIVEVRLRVGDGKLSQLRSRPGLDMLANAAFLHGGVGRHTEQELGEILSGHAVNLFFEVDSDACMFSVRCARRELELALRVIAAFLTDASFRPDSMRHARTCYGTLFASLTASPGGPITMHAMRDMLEGDGRFGIPPYDELSSRHLGELEAWLDPQMKGGPVELSIVGDVSWDDAWQAVAATLGALPKRTPPVDRTAEIPATFATMSQTIRVYPIGPAFRQVAVAWFWPVVESIDIRQERRCFALASVLGERLRVKLREELGATYAPIAGFHRVSGFPNVNYFSFYAEVEPKRAREVLAMLHREAAALGRKGPTADEFERVKQTYLRARTDELRSNAYWGGTVLADAQQHPARIAAARDRATDLAAITRADLTRLARQFLDPARAFKFGTFPTKPDPTDGGSE